MKKGLTYLFLILLSIVIAGCGAPHSPSEGEGADTLAVDSPVAPVAKIDSVYISQLTNDQIDSLEFRLTHHYTINDNFKVLADSIKLVPREDEQSDTTYVFRNEMLAIVKVKRNFVSAEDSLELSQADVNLMKSMEEANQQVDLSSPPPSDIVAAQAKDSTLSIPADTVWVKVATEHKTMGWITESTLLKHTVPNDSISELLRSLTNTRLLWMGGLLLLGILGVYIHRWYNKKNIRMVKINEMDSLYPFLFIMLIAMLACLYSSIQNFAPEYWQEYYFHPTLNPFLLPPVMAILVILVWLIIIVFIALLMETYNHFSFARGVAYFLEIMGASMLVYLFIAWTTRIYIGYILFIILTWFLWVLYNGYVKYKYQCPKCGEKVRSKGKCPKCGAILE